MARRVSPDVGGRDGSHDVSGCKSCSRKFSWFSTPKVHALSSAISECRCVGVFVVAFIDDKWSWRREERASGCPPPTPNTPCLSHVFTSWYVVACTMAVCVRGVRRGDTGVVICAVTHTHTVVVSSSSQLFASQQDLEGSCVAVGALLPAAPPTIASHAR
jgi:hypothetical protein